MNLDKHSTIISVLGSLVFVQAVAIVVIVLLNRHDAPEEAAPSVAVAAAPPSVAAPLQAPVAQPPAARLASSALSVPPAPARLPAPAALPNPFPALGPDEIARLQILQGKFERLSTQQNPDLSEVDALLGELIEIQGTSTIAGVDLNVLRQNLGTARDLQQVAGEMDAEYKKPAPDLKRVEALRQRAAALQYRLVASVRGQPAASAERKDD
jgi:hypothetical protein